jgi:hypothetical protein
LEGGVRGLAFRCYPAICLEGLRETRTPCRDTWSPGRIRHLDETFLDNSDELFGVKVIIRLQSGSSRRVVGCSLFAKIEGVRKDFSLSLYFYLCLIRFQTLLCGSNCCKSHQYVAKVCFTKCCSVNASLFPS